MSYLLHMLIKLSIIYKKQQEILNKLSKLMDLKCLYFTRIIKKKQGFKNNLFKNIKNYQMTSSGYIWTHFQINNNQTFLIYHNRNHFHVVI